MSAVAILAALQHLLRAAALVLGILAATSACQPPGDFDVPDAPAACESRADCGGGRICFGGACLAGTCDPTLEDACDGAGVVDDPTLCCGEREVCSGLELTCVADPDAPPLFCDPADVTCVQCSVQEECVPGQFCSSGLCLDAAGREACTASFQCDDGDHCDRAAFLCVPKRPCATCGPLAAHACCFEGEVCIDEAYGGVCVEPSPEPECDDDGDCPAGLVCDVLRRCAECDATRPCEPGSLCDPDDGACVFIGNCTSDEDCDIGERCAPATSECVVPECAAASDCNADDARFTCDVELFRCELPPAVCVNDRDEENDSSESATPLVLDEPFGAALCREDTDVFAFAVDPSTRYEATVAFTAAAPGVIVTMLNGALAVESTRSLSAAETTVTVAGVTAADESGLMFLQIEGTSNVADQWDYVVTIAITAAPGP